MKSNINLKDFKKIEDIIFIDEAILSHVKYENINFLIYLIDTNDFSNEYMLFEIDENELIKYLTKRVTLRSLIQKHAFVTIFETDFEQNTIQSFIVSVNSLNEDYLPTENSFLEYKYTDSSNYKTLIDQFNKQFYNESLKKNAFYVKFGPSNENKQFGDTLTLNDLTNVFLKNLNTSYKNFIQIDFEKKFSKKIPNDSDRRQLYNEAIKYANLRAVDFKFGSFEIGLSYDSLMNHKIENKEIKEWTNNVSKRYNNIVLDESISENEIDIIMDQYNDDEREKIFKPIIKIIENQNFDIKIKNKDQKTFNTIGLNKKNVSKRILSRSIEKTTDTLPDLQIVQLTTLVDKKNPLKPIRLDGGLFNELNNPTFTLNYSDFVKYGFTAVDSNIEIIVSIHTHQNHVIYSTNFKNENITIESTDYKIEEGMKKVIHKVYELIVQ